MVKEGTKKLNEKKKEREKDRKEKKKKGRKEARTRIVIENDDGVRPLTIGFTVTINLAFTVWYVNPAWGNNSPMVFGTL